MDDGVILQPDDSPKTEPTPAATPNTAADPVIGIAKNAPGFDDPSINNGDRVFEITDDSISPIKEDTTMPAMPIDTIVAKQKIPSSPPMATTAPSPSPALQTTLQTPVPTLPTKPGTEPAPLDVMAPVHKIDPSIPSNIPHRSEMLAASTVANPLIQPTNANLPDMAPAGKPAEVPAAQVFASPDVIVPPPEHHLDPNIPRDPNMKPLRTYESDVADALAREHASVATIAIAANRKKVEEEAEPGPKELQPEPVQRSSPAKKIFLVLLSLIFIGAGVIGAYYLYSKSPLAPATPVTSEQQAIVSLIPSDSYVLLPVDNLTSASFKNRMTKEVAKTQPAGTIKEIIPTKVVGEQVMRVGAPEMATLMDVDVPDILLRSLGRPLMIGVYASPSGEKSIFTVVTTEFFQNTFAGMLQWENLMADDLKFYLFSDEIKGVANIDVSNGGQTTPNIQSGTSTAPAVAPLLTLRGRFVDRIIKNKDVREFISENGQVLFLYSFVDNNKLVITNKETTLAEILTRLEKGASIR